MHNALGEIAFVLDVCINSAGKEIPYISDLIDFLDTDKRLMKLLKPQVVDKNSALGKDYRNKAVHSSVFVKESARVARNLVFEVIFLFSSS